MSYFYIFYNIVENGMVVIVEISFYLMDMESREGKYVFMYMFMYFGVIGWINEMIFLKL